MSHNVGQQATVSTPENVEKTHEMLVQSLQKLIRRAAQEINIKQETLKKIIINDLKLFPTKYKCTIN